MTRSSVPVKLGPLVGVSVGLLAIPLVAWVVNRIRQSKQEEEGSKTEGSGSTSKKEESDAKADTATAQGAAVADGDAGGDAGGDETPKVEASDPDAPADPMQPTLDKVTDEGAADTTATEEPAAEPEADKSAEA